MKKILVALVLLATSVSFAGPRIVGNGGVGVRENGHLYMLDLYERGIHRSPYYAPDLKPFKWMDDEVATVFSMTNMASVPLQKLTYKMNEVLQKSYFRGLALHAAVLGLDWRLVDSDLAPLEDIKTPLEGEFEQIAVRQENVVFIAAKLWNQLDDDNKVALILHEAFYYLATPQEIKSTAGSYFQQRADQARSVTGLIFTKRFAVEGFTSLNSTFEVVVPYFKKNFRKSRDQSIYRMDLAMDLYFTGSFYNTLSNESFDISAMTTASNEEVKPLIEKWAKANCSLMKQRYIEGMKNNKGTADLGPKTFLLTTSLLYVQAQAFPHQHIRQNGESQRHLSFKGFEQRHSEYTKIKLKFASPAECEQLIGAAAYEILVKNASYQDQ